MTTVLAYYPAVVTVALVSGAISAASMLINDYFDWASGEDAHPAALSGTCYLG